MSQLTKLGGKKGYYYDNILWKLLGFIDRLLGGTRLNRGRRHPLEIRPGDAVGFFSILDGKAPTLLGLFVEPKIAEEKK
jgi:hypothetical protein